MLLYFIMLPVVFSQYMCKNVEENIIKKDFLEDENIPGSFETGDPIHHIKDETYVEFTRLYQGYVSQTCNGASQELFDPKCNSKGLHVKGRCVGRITNCTFLNVDMIICPSKDQTRRYDFIKYENGSILGDETQLPCNNRSIEIRRKTTCPYCMCMCEQTDPLSDKFVNLRGSVADISNNRVVTGLRFTKIDRIIHLQIEEAELLPYGQINDKTLHWVDVNSYRITDEGIENKKDYHILDSSERTVHLDDISVDAGYIVTGVRFQVEDGALNFEIRMTKFDYVKGLVFPDETVWKKSEISKEERKEIKLEKVDVPTKSKSSTVFSKSGDYLLFTHTDLEKDVAQTTVPFLDTQPLTLSKPLIGVGIFHKMEEGYGGFIAPKIKIMN